MSKTQGVRVGQTAHLQTVSDKRLLRDRERDAAAEEACRDLGSLAEKDCSAAPHEHEGDHIPLVFDDLIKAWQGVVLGDTPHCVEKTPRPENPGGINSHAKAGWRIPDSDTVDGGDMGKSPASHSLQHDGDLRHNFD